MRPQAYRPWDAEPAGVRCALQLERVEGEVVVPREEPPDDLLVLTRVERARAVHQPPTRPHELGRLRQQGPLQLCVAEGPRLAPGRPRGGGAPERALAG